MSWPNLKSGAKQTWTEGEGLQAERGIGLRKREDFSCFGPKKKRGILITFLIKLITEMIFELLKILPMLK